MELLWESRLARLYTHLLQQGSTTVKQTIEENDMARSTVYKDVNRLAELGVLTKDETTEPLEIRRAGPSSRPVRPRCVRGITSSHRRCWSDVSTENEDIATFVERNGLAALAAAIDYAAANYRGEITQRMAAQEMDLHPVEGVTVITALRTVLANAIEYDPYFDSDEVARTGE